MQRVFGNTKIPAWLEQKLFEMSPDPNFNTLIEVMLIDFIKRNAPPSKEDLALQEELADIAEGD